jgi:hypothetical protein
LDLRQAIKKGEYFETIKEMAYCRATSAFTFPVVVREFKVRTVGRIHSLLSQYGAARDFLFT